MKWKAIKKCFYLHWLYKRRKKIAIYHNSSSTKASPPQGFVRYTLLTADHKIGKHYLYLTQICVIYVYGQVAEAKTRMGVEANTTTQQNSAHQEDIEALLDVSYQMIQ